MTDAPAEVWISAALGDLGNGLAFESREIPVGAGMDPLPEELAGRTSYTRSDLADALVAAAYEEAADYVNGLQPGKLTAPDSEWMHADPSKIRALPPADAQTALERIVQERLWEALNLIDQIIDAKTELFASDRDLILNIKDRIRAMKGDSE